MITKTKALALVILFLGAILIAGCETCKGTVEGAAKGATDGAKKDWDNLKNADAKMREVLW